MNTNYPDNFEDFYKDAFDKDVYFILGCQGSGTNLLSRMLMRVYDFSVVRDRALIFNAAAKVYQSPTPEIVRKESQRVYDSLFPASKFQRTAMFRHYHHQNNNYVGIDQHLHQMGVESADQLAYFFYSYHAFVNKAQNFAVKSDDIWINLSYLPKVFPNAKFIHLVRDYRDNVLSIMRKNFGPRDIYSGAHYVRERINAYHNLINQQGENAIEVKYEELLADPRAFLERFTSAFKFAPVRDIDQQLAELQIRSGNKQKWRNLSKSDLATCESVLQDELRRSGYPLVNENPPKIPATSALGHQIRDAVLRVPQKLGFMSKTLAE